MQKFGFYNLLFKIFLRQSLHAKIMICNLEKLIMFDKIVKHLLSLWRKNEFGVWNQVSCKYIVYYILKI
jgi:hypothetical protein